MDKNKKSTDTQHKTGTAGRSEKEVTKHDILSRKMMDESDTKPEKRMNTSSGKAAMSDKTSKGK